MKIIFGSDHVISESFDARYISYGYDQSVLYFNTRQNKSKNFGELMSVGKGLKSIGQIKNLSFVVESLSPLPVNDKTKKLEDRFCYQNSEPNLRELIVNCEQAIVLRNLTLQEEWQIDGFKEQFQNSPLGLFTMTFDQGRITSYSQFVDHFSASLAYYDRKTSQLWVSSHDKYSNRHINFMNFNGHQQGYFVIDSVPRARELNCMDTPLSKLIVECQGGIYLRQ